MKFKLDEVDSTNEEVKRIIKNNDLKNYNDIFLVYADAQTHGKGTKNHSWDSNGDDIYMSICFEVDKINYAKLMMSASVIILNKLKKEIGHAKQNLVKIKWPNDIYIADKKIAGILFEKVKYEDKYFLIIGIGINVNRSSEVLKLKNDVEKTNNITSLFLETNRLHSKEEIIDEIFFDIKQSVYQSNDENSKNYNDEEIYKLYRNNSYILNKTIKIKFLNDNSISTYTVKDILKNGKIIINNNLDELIVSSNEIEILEIKD